MMEGTEGRMLFTVDEVMGLLNLDKPAVEWLTNTTQLQPIRICGQERYDARDVRRLIDSYKTTQKKRKY
jgi:hypothetical protein